MSKKKSISFTLFLILSFTLFGDSYNVNAKASSQTLPVSTMSEEECLSFIKEKGINIPKDYQDDGELIKKLIIDAQTLPEGCYPYNNTELVKLAKDIRRVVNQTEGVRASSYQLQDSTVWGSWSDSYLDYNCYGFAINRTSDFVNPGYYSNQSFSRSLSIDDMASLVIDDLDKLGYWSYSTNRKPTESSLATYERAICIRKGSKDYHFMKLMGSTWRHKPGNTAILSYNYSNPDIKASWSNELSFRGVAYAPTIWYDSSVKYIIYWSKDVGPQPPTNHQHNGWAKF